MFLEFLELIKNLAENWYKREKYDKILRIGQKLARQTSMI